MGVDVRPLQRGDRAIGGLLAASVVLAFLAAGPARADSVVYMKDNAVWIANADGSGARQFTLYQYGWAWPSEDDNGNVVRGQKPGAPKR